MTRIIQAWDEKKTALREAYRSDDALNQLRSTILEG